MPSMSDFLTLALIFLTALYVYLTGRLVKGQTDPLVSVSLVPHSYFFGIFDLLVRNAGHGPARRVRFTATAEPGADAKIVNGLLDLGVMKGIDYLGPGQELRSYFYNLNEGGPNVETNTKIKVKVDYETPDRRALSDAYVLDMMPYWQSKEVGEHPLVAIKLEMRKIEARLGEIVQAIQPKGSTGDANSARPTTALPPLAPKS